MKVPFPSARLLLWLGLLIAAIPARAAAGIRVGAEVGVNYSSLHYDQLDGVPSIYWDPGWRPSFTGGVTLDVPIARRFGLVTGLRYVQQGNRVEFNIPDPPTAEGEFRLYEDYLSVPLLLSYRPAATPRFFIALGPEIGFLLGAHSVGDFSTPDLPERSDDDTDIMESMNVMVDASVGYEFPIQTHVGVVSLRYTHGLTGIAQEDSWVTDFQTRGVEFLLGMRW